MKIKLITGISGYNGQNHPFDFKAGSVVEIEDAEAQRHIDGGNAELADDDAKAVNKPGKWEPLPKNAPRAESAKDTPAAREPVQAVSVPEASAPGGDPEADTQSTEPPQISDAEKAELEKQAKIDAKKDAKKDSKREK